MKLLHLIKDEKFPDSAYEFFEAVAAGQSTYMLDGKAEPIKHLEKITPVRVSKYAFLSSRFIRSLKSYDAIILHSLFPFALEVLARIDSRVPVVWIGMGYDYYDLINGNAKSLLKSETQKIYNPSTSRFRKKPLKKIMIGVVRKILHPNVFRKRSLIKKIDLFAPVLKSEYPLVNTAAGDPFPEYIQWNYGKIADLVDGRLGSKRVNGKNILVGNSATPTNNHLDAFELLVKAGIPSDSNIVVPLSYGDPNYRDKVIAAGKNLFGDNFKPITEFMSMDEYISLLSSCSSVVMNHLRQQAAGNLFIMAYLGARLYLDSENPIYEELRSMGLTVNTLAELSLDSEHLNSPLDYEVVKRNQQILKETKGRAAFERCTENLLARVAQLKAQKGN